MLEKWLNKIHLGDCLELMGQIPAESIDLVITSPPYNLRNSSGGGMRNGSGGLWENAALLEGYACNQGDDMPRPEYVKWQRDCLTAMMRLLKDTGAIFYNHKWRVQNGLLEDQKEIVDGFPVRQVIIWQRAGGINFNLGYYLPTYEVIYLITKSEKFRLAEWLDADPDDPEGGNQKAACGVGDIWTIPQQDKKNGHPAPFPLEIPKRILETTGAQIVLDPFMGSGTTALAAEMRCRQWIGVEIARPYVNQANKRIAEWRKLSTQAKSAIDNEEKTKLLSRRNKLRRELEDVEERVARDFPAYKTEMDLGED